jgi:hypothetical protein
MKLSSILVLFFLFVLQIQSQTITGKVTDADSGEPLVYVSIGVMTTTIGTITDEKGNFSLEIKEQPIEALVRFSMIGYKPQTFSIEELRDNANVIKLKIEPVELAKIDIRFGKIKKVGNTKSSRFSGVCGWGGTKFGKGHELGTKIDLGAEPIKLLSLHIKVYKQSFDRTLLRLHIRDIIDSLPHNELLSENILIVLTAKSGWVDVDLSKYELILSGEIALTLEWLKIIGIYEDRYIKTTTEGVESTGPKILFSTIGNPGWLYTKWGVENNWKLNFDQSPSFYLTVQE